MSKLILWECSFSLDTGLWVDECLDYWLSTSPITAETEQRFWDKIHHKGADTVSNFSCKPAGELPEGVKPMFRILSRVYHEGG